MLQAECLQSLTVPLAPATCMQAELTRKRLERAGKLTSGLASEGVRWGSAAEALAAQAVQLVSV